MNTGDGKKWVFSMVREKWLNSHRRCPVFEPMYALFLNHSKKEMHNGIVAENGIEEFLY